MTSPRFAELPGQRQTTAVAVVGELRRLAERHEALARELFARAGYWRADAEAIEHSVVARALLTDADALERHDATAVDR